MNSLLKFVLSFHFPFPVIYFLQNLKVREEGNPIYAFLFDLDCQEGQYYRWRTFGKHVLVRYFLFVSAL